MAALPRLRPPPRRNQKADARTLEKNVVRAAPLRVARRDSPRRAQGLDHRNVHASGQPLEEDWRPQLMKQKKNHPWKKRFNPSSSSRPDRRPNESLPPPAPDARDCPAPPPPPQQRPSQSPAAKRPPRTA